MNNTPSTPCNLCIVCLQRGWQIIIRGWVVKIHPLEQLKK